LVKKRALLSLDVGSGERFNSIEEAFDSGLQPGDIVIMWDKETNTYRRGKLPELK